MTPATNRTSTTTQTTMAPLTPADGPLGRLEGEAALLSLSLLLLLLLLAPRDPVAAGAEAMVPKESEVAVIGVPEAVVRRWVRCSVASVVVMVGVAVSVFVSVATAARIKHGLADGPAASRLLQ